MSARTFILMALALLVLGGGWIWWSRVPVASPPTMAQPLAGHPAPDFTLSQVGGGELSLADLRGRPVVLNFWATWCAPCEAEMPELEQAYRRYGNAGLVVIGVNQGEDEATVRAYADRLGLSFPLVRDGDTQVGRRYRVEALPTTFFIDREGIIREQVIGQMNTAVLRQRLRSIFP
ncbi:MAG: TlpA disulfide reductase family protein [Anaerolineae bacterium]|nr:TlpA family protein disulfide reductase [Caldilineales bacterium]MDW8268384.1 TlpA disulfide reductase family protein [Anaerolineae bacterium]